MELTPLLDLLLNSVDSVFLKCGSAVITPNYDSLLTSPISQPFTLITQITGAPILFGFENTLTRVEPGEALIVPANTVYTLKLIDDKKAVTSWLNLNYTIMEHFSIFDFIHTPFIASSEIGDEIGKLHARFMHIGSQELDYEKALTWAVELKQLLFAMLTVIVSTSRYKEGSLDKLNQVKHFNKVFGYIEEHLAEKIKIPQLAQLMYLSTSQFHKQFQEAFDISPLQYVRMQRYKKAQFLLATTPMTMSDIAEQIGFDSPIPFFRFFKSMNGVSPGHYRKVIAGNLNSEPI
ncbi:MAG: AraC family transcriptional regulator [Paenibacillus sp.]|jgi:AraC-like DNA-binding protein|nr:AraC family transcriptional regulator [Paenibacillus sp.]